MYGYCIDTLASLGSHCSLLLLKTIDCVSYLFRGNLSPTKLQEANRIEAGTQSSYPVNRFKTQCCGRRDHNANKLMGRQIA